MQAQKFVQTVPVRIIALAFGLLAALLLASAAGYVLRGGAQPTTVYVPQAPIYVPLQSENQMERENARNQMSVDVEPRLTAAAPILDARRGVGR